MRQVVEMRMPFLGSMSLTQLNTDARNLESLQND